MIVKETFNIENKRYVVYRSSINGKSLVLGGVEGEIFCMEDTDKPISISESLRLTAEEHIAKMKSQIEALRDAALLPTTKALYEEILKLFEGD